MNIDGQRELLVSDPSISCNQPVLLAPRKLPFKRVSSVDYSKDNGVYYMQDIYAGDGMKGIERGTVKKMRIVEIIYRCASVGEAYGEDKGGGGHAATPVGVGNASWDVKRVVGTVDVEEDGSAFSVYLHAAHSISRHWTKTTGWCRPCVAGQHSSPAKCKAVWDVMNTRIRCRWPLIRSLWQ